MSVVGKSSPSSNLFRTWSDEKTVYGCLVGAVS